ncbi:hypothetical protein AMJ39_02340 [candidate division TA06 bacterium DG_24]|uniref:FlgD/Vpr Ig-like domain-containing protein n=3 Tax=Bacteria division TA06 TaxID=1156500 RepID=A0A0S8JI50_UNCT6|nr:MAG: hypothetical protein AMJ39_02340 [candidate division TA06 bacterium DG_24]KPK69070.1 MAG: hypothetical protein AMJ82_06550 [candidate division TA06 bacterium SM23_40]KPL09383.1 MAG: hypothetical protein AMJ71_06565 [candidate division TA06 bacterium SM1_40]
MKNVVFACGVVVLVLSVALPSWAAHDGAVSREAISRPMARAGVPTATPPPFWQLSTVRNDADYLKQDGTGDSPLSYPGFTHIAHDMVEDVPFCLWREGSFSDADLLESHWNDLFLFWTTPVEVIADELVARRGNGLMYDDNGVIHVAGAFGPGSGGPFDIRYARRDPVAGTWGASVQLSVEDDSTDYFPAGTVDSNGNVWVEWERVITSPAHEAILAYKSTDGGETWDPGNREVIVDPFDGGWSTWNMFADPSNGDVWGVTGAFGNEDLFNDLCIWHYVAAQDTWMGPEIPVVGDMALNDSLGWQVAMPQIVIDSQHNAHVVFEMNGQDDPATNPRTLTVIANMGPYGTMHYVNNVGGDWSDPVQIFVAPDTIKPQTDSVCGVPSIGIDAFDNLYISFSQALQVDSLTATGVIWSMPVDAYMSYNPYDPVAQEWLGWSDRVKLSDLPIWELGPDSLVGADSVALYPGVTPRVPSSGETAGPGFFWCEWLADNSANDYHMIDFKYVHASLCTLPTGISVEEPVSVRRDGLFLGQNRPNPFWKSTEIAYGLPQSGHVRLEIHNVLGQRVRTLVDRFQDAGRHRVIWDRRDESGAYVASGIYFYRLEGPGTSKNKKMAVLN